MILFQDILFTKEECKFLSDKILKNESNIKELGEDKYPGTSSDSLTGRYFYYNLLSYDSEIEKIVSVRLRELFSKLSFAFPISIKCWANTFRKNEGIDFHIHSKQTFLSANLFLSGDTKPGTTYFIDNREVTFENRVGEFTLFLSNLKHKVYPNKSDDVRISIAMDITIGEKISNEFILKKCQQYFS